MWKYITELGRPHIIIWRMRIAFWVPKATHTFKICNTYCFTTATNVARTPPPMSHYTYTACLVSSCYTKLRFYATTRFVHPQWSYNIKKH